MHITSHRRLQRFSRADIFLDEYPLRVFYVHKHKHNNLNLFSVTEQTMIRVERHFSIISFSVYSHPFNPPHPLYIFDQPAVNMKLIRSF